MGEPTEPRVSVSDAGSIPDHRADYLPKDELADALARWIATAVVAGLVLAVLTQLPNWVLFWLSPPTLLFVPVLAALVLFGIMLKACRWILAQGRKIRTTWFSRSK